MKRRVFLGLAATGAAAAAAGGYWLYGRMTRRAADFRDVAYGPDARHRLDIYLPRGEGPFPFVYEIHGGAFMMGSKEMAAAPESLLEAGIAIVRPNYRLSGTDPWPAQIEDCAAGLAHVRAEAAAFRLQEGAFAIWGQSAGGFLAVSLALQLVEAGDPPRAVVDFYGPMDFSTMDSDLAALGREPTMGATGAADSPESKLLGFAVGEDPARARAVGPIARLEAMGGKALPPLFLRHGDADPMIAHLQSERLAAAWAATVAPTGAPAEVDFALVAGAGHGGTAFDEAAVMGALRDFLLPRLGQR